MSTTDIASPIFGNTSPPWRRATASDLVCYVRHNARASGSVGRDNISAFRKVFGKADPTINPSAPPQLRLNRPRPAHEWRAGEGRREFGTLANPNLHSVLSTPQQQRSLPPVFQVGWTPVLF